MQLSTFLLLVGVYHRTGFWVWDLVGFSVFVGLIIVVVLAVWLVLQTKKVPGLWKYHAGLGPISFRTSQKFLFTCSWTSTMYKVNTILYFIFWLIITSSHLALKTKWILISWLLQKPADLELHCFQEKPVDQDPYCLQELIYISGFILFLKE